MIVAPVPPLVYPPPIITVPLKVEVPSTIADPFTLRTQASVLVALVQSFTYPPPILTVPVNVEALPIVTVPVTVEALSTVVALFALRSRIRVDGTRTTGCVATTYCEWSCKVEGSCTLRSPSSVTVAPLPPFVNPSTIATVPLTENSSVRDSLAISTIGVSATNCHCAVQG